MTQRPSNLLEYERLPEFQEFKRMLEQKEKQQLEAQPLSGEADQPSPVPGSAEGSGLLEILRNLNVISGERAGTGPAAPLSLIHH